MELPVIYKKALRKAHDFMAHYIGNPDWNAIALDSSQFQTPFEADLYNVACKEVERMHGENSEQISIN